VAPPPQAEIFLHTRRFSETRASKLVLFFITSKRMPLSARAAFMKNGGLIWRRTFCIAIALAIASAIGLRASADDARGDEFWLISTRHLAEVSCDDLPSQLEVERLEFGAWRPASVDEFAASHEPAAVTVFYVHGNRYAPHHALEHGFAVRERLRQCDPSTPVRFVIWSWPSERIPGLLHDCRAKAQRTDLEGFYLGAVLSRLPPDARVSLVGFSFGTRIISGSLHVLAGGELEGRSLPPHCVSPRLPVRAAMLAPACHNTWLLPGSFHSRALTQVDRMLVLYNSRDPILRRYRLLSPATSPQALGYTGLVGLEQLGPLEGRVEQWDMAGVVGATHTEERYFSSPFFTTAGEQLLWDG
jgi:hypothetical protein